PIRSSRPAIMEAQLVLPVASRAAISVISLSAAPEGVGATDRAKAMPPCMPAPAIVRKISFETMAQRITPYRSLRT
ncbi:hypothetical protein, partial [Sphingomonas sp. LH128]